MANTFVKIQTATVGVGGASTIDFTSIPQTYKDLAINLSSRTSRAATQANLAIKFNNSTSNLTSQVLYGIDTSATTYASTQIEFGSTGNNGTTNAFGIATIYISNYASSINKTVSLESSGETNDANLYMHITAGLWQNNSAITTVTLYLRDAATTFNQYTTATLYGIKSS